MSKFTKGPWKAGNEKFGKFRGIGIRSEVDGVQQQIAFCLNKGNENVESFTDSLKANAHLIAAAPDIYEVLADIQKWWDEGESSKDILRQSRKGLKAALAKARGEEL